jgi:hypothetical protein
VDRNEDTDEDEEDVKDPDGTEDEDDVEEGIRLDDVAGYDLEGPGDVDYDPGDRPSQRERFEAGLQDTMDLSEWKMPDLVDYSWYIIVYGVLMTLAVYVIVRHQFLAIYILWGGYLAALIFLAYLIVRSFNYRRRTFSKGFVLATLDLQTAVERAIEGGGRTIDFVDRPKGAFLRPLIAVYRPRGVDWTVSIEGRGHLQRKVVRVGRLVNEEQISEGSRLCLALDDEVERQGQRRKARTLFKD